MEIETGSSDPLWEKLVGLVDEMETIYVKVWRYARAGSRSLLQTLKIRRSRWLGHMRRMPYGRLLKDILYSQLCTGSRPRGRPILRFKDVAKWNLVALGWDMNQWEVLAEDRPAWRSALKVGGERLATNWLQKLAEKRTQLTPQQRATALCIVLHAFDLS